MRRLSPIDRLVATVDRAMAAVASASPSSRPSPAGAQPEGELSPAERELSGALMRVNHVGEICAQALYEGHALTTKDPELETFFRKAAQEEADHLAWTKQRLDELGARPSLLNPLWFGGAFAMGAVAGLLGRRVALGFMQETERQVEHHLAGHETRLPDADLRSRAVVAQMKADEVAHADEAAKLGAAVFPAPVKALMRATAAVMTTTAHRI